MVQGGVQTVAGGRGWGKCRCWASEVARGGCAGASVTVLKVERALECCKWTLPLTWTPAVNCSCGPGTCHFANWAFAGSPAFGLQGRDPRRRTEAFKVSHAQCNLFRLLTRCDGSLLHAPSTKLTHVVSSTSVALARAAMPCFACTEPHQRYTNAYI